MKTTSKWKISLAVAVVAVASGTMIAGSSAGGPTVQKSSEIVADFSQQQSKSDQLPNAVVKTFAPVGIDPTMTRFVGESADLEYFAVPMGSDEICLITVNGDGSAGMMGCTVVKGFEGLRVSNGDKTEEAWLVAPAGAQKALDSTDRSQWVQTAPNFLVKSDSQGN